MVLRDERKQPAYLRVPSADVSMRQLGVKEWLQRSISGSMHGCLALPTLNARELAMAIPHPGNIC